MNNNSIILHNVNNKTVEQLAEETQLNNIVVPRGYVNLTAMCKAHGKKIDNYFRLKSTKAFIQETSTVTHIVRDRLIIAIKGGNNKSIQGTWGHPNVAVNLAQWLSPRFAALASDVIVKVMKGEYVAVTEEAEKSQQELNEIAYRLITPNLQACHDRLEEIEDYYLPGDDRYTSYAQWSL